MPETSSILDPNLALLSKQMRFNPLRGITPASLSNALDQFDAGYLRWAVLAWEEMVERDDKLTIAVPKMIRRVASRPWDVLIGEEVPEAQMAEAESHQAALKYFYSNLRCRDVLRKDKKGGLKMLISALMKAPLHRFAPPVGLEWKPSSAGMGCVAHIAPLQLFEETRGELRFAGVEYTTPGRELGDERNWLIAVADTCLMKALSICYMFKRLPLTDALNFCQRFGIPGIHGEIAATKGSPEWNDFMAALRAYANDAIIATSAGAKVNILETAAANGEQVFGWIIETMNRAMVTICLGSDLATMSRDNGTGASLQGDDADELTAAHCEFVSETLREQLDRRVIEWAFGEGTEPLAFFQLIPPSNDDTALEMQIDNHVKEHGVRLAVDDIAERYNRTHDESAVDVPGDDADAVNEARAAQGTERATLAALRRRGGAAFLAGSRADLEPLTMALVPLVDAQGEDATRNAALALEGEMAGMEEAILNGGASTAALEVAFATEFLRGLAAPGEVEDFEDETGWQAGRPLHDPEATNDNPYHDERGRFTDASRARSVRSKARKDVFGPLPAEDGDGLLTPAQNIERGEKALAWAVRNKTDVLNAMFVPGFGRVEFPWGRPGHKANVGGKTHTDGFGISHIIDKHGLKAAKGVPRALATGKIYPHPNKDTPHKRLVWDGKTLVSMARKNEHSAYTLTGIDQPGAAYLHSQGIYD